MVPQEIPRRRLSYVSAVFDSGNWDGFRPRPGDVVITTSYKSGTTWMQNILRQLVFPEPPRPAVSEISPWVDRQRPDPAAMLAGLEAQRHRRFVKSHLPAEALPYFPEVRYIVVVRDPRDVFMSFWSHYSGYTEAYFAEVPPGMEPMPRCPADLHALWPLWLGQGAFPWESEGWPHSGNLFHTASWWRFRRLSNVGFFHFADLLADLPGEITRVADFLGIPLDPARRDAIAEAASFEALRRDAAATPVGAARIAALWRDGVSPFFNRGTNGRWRGVLSEAELALCAATVARCLPPEAAAYLAGGRAAWAGAAACDD